MIFAIDSVLKTIPWTYKIKYLKVEKIIESFKKKRFLWPTHNLFGLCLDSFNISAKPWRTFSCDFFLTSWKSPWKVDEENFVFNKVKALKPTTIKLFQKRSTADLVIS